MSKIYLETFDSKRQEVFKKLAPFARYGYLSGGTALALQLNHRRSVDFDIFVDRKISNTVRLKVKTIFGQDISFEVNSDDQITCTTKEGIKITVLWYYFKRIKPLIQTDAIALASVEDIAADKAYTVGRRAVWRDYVDIFYLLQTNIVTLEKIIDLAQKKFSGEFNEAQFLEQLSYFADLTIAPIKWIDKPYSSEEIQSFLVRQTEIYLRNQLK